jgi:hypothetical protein
MTCISVLKKLHYASLTPRINIFHRKARPKTRSSVGPNIYFPQNSSLPKFILLPFFNLFLYVFNIILELRDIHLEFHCQSFNLKNIATLYPVMQNSQKHVNSVANNSLLPRNQIVTCYVHSSCF